LSPILSAVPRSAPGAVTPPAAVRQNAAVRDSIEFVEDAPSRESALKEINALLARVRALPESDAAPADPAALTTRDAPFAVYTATIARSFVATPTDDASVFAKGAASGASAQRAQAAYAATAADAPPPPVTNLPALLNAPESSLDVIRQALADVSKARAEIDASVQRLSGK
jgi:hypothetical protein